MQKQSVKRRHFLAFLALVVCAAALAPFAEAQEVLYASLGGFHDGHADGGAIATVDQTTGAVTVLAVPVPGRGITGLESDSTGRLFGVTSDQDGALNAQLIEIDPGNAAEYYLVSGAVNVRLKRFDAAEKSLQKAVEIAPRSARGYGELARLYLYMNKNLTKAKSLAQTAVRLKPDASNYFVLSKAHDKNGDRPSAVSAMRRAVELAPDNMEYRRIYELLQRKN